MKKISIGLICFIQICAALCFADGNEEYVFDTSQYEYSDKGEWHDSGFVSNGATKLRASSASGDVALWRIKVPEDIYRIYFWKSLSENGCKNGKATLYKYDGVPFVEKNINFSEGKAGWVDMGMFYISSVSVTVGEATVELTGDGNGEVLAGSVKFVKVSENEAELYRFFNQYSENAILMKSDSNKFFADNKELTADVAPETAGDNIMIPLRIISEVFDYKIQWDDETRSVSVVADDNIIVFTETCKSASLNSEKIILDTAPIIKNDRIMISLSDVAELMKKKYFYDDSGLIIIADRFDESIVKDLSVIQNILKNFEGK